jgi:predicted membrane GTPase involved in stress response
MRIQETSSPDMMIVFGRGILHLSILIKKPWDREDMNCK